MKIIVVSRSSGGSLQTVVGADSAILRCGEPVFLPEDTSGWCSIVAPAVRISRLGTHIPLARASAFYDGIAAFHVLKPQAGVEGVSWAVCDRAFSPGVFYPVPKDGFVLKALSRSISTRRDAAESQKVRDIDLSAMDVDGTVSHLSRFCTFKTGDILVFEDFGLNLGEPCIDTGLRSVIGDNVSLDIRLK